MQEDLRWESSTKFELVKNHSGYRMDGRGVGWVEQMMSPGDQHGR